MKYYRFFTLVAWVMVAATAAVAGEKWTFEDTSVGRLPEGCSTAKTGEGVGSIWEVQRDESAAEKESGGPKPNGSSKKEISPIRLLNVKKNIKKVDLRMFSSQ